MTKRPPDSRVPFGQQIEDRLDTVSHSMRRDTAKWLERQMRAAPNDAEVLGAMIGGIATALLDELNKASAGDPDRIRSAWALFADSYIAAQVEDEAADAEPVSEPQP